MITRKYKKADMTMSEIVKITLGAICIFFLIYLATSLYTIFTRNPELEQARAMLDEFVSKAEILSDGVNTSILVVGPQDWTLYLFNKNLQSPSDCSGSSCACVCPGMSLSVEDGLTSCEKQGACKKTEAVFFINSINGFFTYGFGNLPMALYFQNKIGAIKITSEIEFFSEKLINRLASFEEAKKMIIAAADNPEEEIKVNRLRNYINNFLPKAISGSAPSEQNASWDLAILKNGEEALRINSENMDDVQYTLLLVSEPYKGSLTSANNIVYEVELRSNG